MICAPGLGIQGCERFARGLDGGGGRGGRSEGLSISREVAGGGPVYGAVYGLCTDPRRQDGGGSSCGAEWCNPAQLPAVCVGGGWEPDASLNAGTVPRRLSRTNPTQSRLSRFLAVTDLTADCRQQLLCGLCRCQPSAELGRPQGIRWLPEGPRDAARSAPVPLRSASGRTRSCRDGPSLSGVTFLLTNSRPCHDVVLEISGSRFFIQSC